MKNFDKTFFKDDLFIDWHLLDGINHDCEYSHESAGADNESYERAPLMETAWRLLSMNRSQYIFHFYGGEPTIHPFFPDLFKAISTSGKNACFLLDTNGLRGAKYFTDLLAQTMPARAVINLEVHPNCLDLKTLLYVIAAIVEGRQLCRLRVNCVPSSAEKAKLICEKLITFRVTIPFLLELRMPLGGSFPWAQSIETGFKNITQLSLVWPDWAEIKDKQKAPQPGSWVCLGVNSCHVKKNGEATLGLLAGDMPFAGCVLPKAVMLPGLPPPPSFPQKEAAMAYLREYQRAAIRRLFDSPFPHWPLNREIAREQRLLSALKHLPPNVLRKNKAEACPALLAERLKDILKAYEILTVETDKLVFLGRLKAALIGDTSYLLDQSGERKEISVTVEAKARLNETHFFDAEAGSESLRDFFQRILWSQSPFEIMTLAAETLIDTLLQAHAALPDYELHLRQVGMTTVIVGKSMVMPKNFLAPRQPLKEPLLSIILTTADDPADLSASLERVVGLPHYQAIVILDEKSLVLADAVNEYVKRSHWRIRPVFINNYVSAPEAWSLGLEFAQGDYVCFLRSGDAIEGEAIAGAVGRMSASGADIAMEGGDTSTGYIENDNPIELILRGDASMREITGKIYRRSVLTGHAISLQKFLNLMTYGALNFAAFHFARKVLAVPGILVKKPYRLANAINFTEWLNTLSQFCVAHNIRVANTNIGAWLAGTFMQSLESAVPCAQSIEENESLQLGYDALRILFENRGSARIICEKVAQYMDITEAKQINNSAACHCSTALPNSPKPLLSVVFSVEEGFSPEMLEEPLARQCPETEWLLIDNTAQRSMAMDLAYLVDINANVRVGAMDAQAHPAVCANHGMEQTRGKYIIFLDSATHAAPELIKNALHIVSGGANNIFAFGSRQSPGAYKGIQFLERVFERGNDLRACVFIYDRRFLIANELAFESCAPDWKTDLFLRALLKSGVTLAQGRAFLEDAPKRSLWIQPGGERKYLAAYDDILRESTNWKETARKNLEAWFGDNLARAWLALQRSGADMDSAQMPYRVASLLCRTLFAKYMEAEEGDG